MGLHPGYNAEVDQMLGTQWLFQFFSNLNSRLPCYYCSN